MNDNAAVAMLKLGGTLLPADMIPDADLKRRWQMANSWLENAPPAEKAAAYRDLDALGREITAALGPMIMLKALMSAPRRSMLDLGRG